jgi:hypothetical protein
VVANSGSTAASAVVTLIPNRGPKRTISIGISPHGATHVAEAVPHGAPWIGGIVDVDAGAVAVEQVVNGPLGLSAAPCATSGSSHWYFATGITLVNAGVEISLLNPYPTDSIVDLSFSTDQGIESPQDFQGLDVPGGGVLNVDLGSHLRRRKFIATTVTARTGSVVAWKTEWAHPPARGAVLFGTPAANNPLADPAWPIPGITVTLGSPSAGTTWAWPDGLAGNGLDERYVVYNPGPTTASVRLSLGLDQGAAEPFDLSVGPYQVVPVISSQQARIPSGVAHSAVLRSLNGVAVVAERVVVAAPSGSSQARSGLGEIFGGRVTAARWLVPAAVADPHHDGVVILYNPGAQSVSATVDALTRGGQIQISGPAPIPVGPGRRVELQLTEKRSVNEPLVVSASGMIYVESDTYGRAKTGGLSLSFGVPLTP